MHKILLIFGTRPEAIKLCPVIRSLREHPNKFHVTVCVTAQHREMLDQVLEAFEVKPDHDLDLMLPGQTLWPSTSRILAGLEPVLRAEKPAMVMVQGDTTTTLCGALAAFYSGIPLAHVEAGLRTHDMRQPFPEEMNRRLTGTIASYHFAPTPLAREHLLQEHVDADDIIVTGNTVIDAFLETARRTDLSPPPRLDELDPKRPIILVTAHRRENHPYMREMCEAMREIAQLPLRAQIYWPVHPSPHVRPIAYEILGDIEGVTLVDPIDYAQMVVAVKAATFVLTDSGGLQEEAPTLGKPVLVMREETERPEGLEAGTLELVGHDRAAIVSAASRLLSDRDAYARMARAVNPYGDGHAAPRIVAWLLARLRGGRFPEPFAAAVL